MQKMTLSKIAIALSVCYASSYSYAEIQAANGNTQISTQKGVEIVNIATPSQAGLSHNQYHKFNVDKSGAVLNNARQASQSQLAGNVAANPNLRQQSATVILNEVVSRNPSRLVGKQEIVGQKADYVLVNPNGIDVEGGGFINTPRASLVVGKANVENGKLTGYQVDGDNKLSAKGTISGAHIDLIAPTVNVAANVEADGDVNVLMGRNQVARNDAGQLTVSVLPQQGQVLDGKVAGSIQAGRIRIHSTDSRATLSVNGSDLSAKKDVIVTAGNAKLDGTITKKSEERHQEIKGKITGSNSKWTDKENLKKTTIKGENVAIVVENNLEVKATDIQAKEAMIIGGKTHLGSSKTTNRQTFSENRFRGSYKHHEEDNSRIETAHKTTIRADKVKLVATKDQLTGRALQVDTNQLVLQSEKGIALKGEQENNYYDALAHFRNEPKKHRTGLSTQTAIANNYVASELNVKGDMVVSGNHVDFAGTIGRIDGDLVIENKGKLSFVSEEVKNSHVVDDKEKYWGGLAGSKALASKRNDIEQQGADFTVKGAILIDSQQGVKISGSRVVSGKDALVKGNNGSLTLDVVQDYHSYSEKGRKGMIFDITKERSRGFKTVYYKFANLFA